MRMLGYNLTDRQKELLRLMVERVKSRAVTEPFLRIGARDGYSLHPQSGEAFDIGTWGLGDLDALVDADLLSARTNTQGTSQLYSIKQAGYDAVDSDFSAPDVSFLAHLTPLADVSNLDQEIKSRCLPILGAGSADPKLWDSAVRTAGVILEDRLRQVGGIRDAGRVGRDLVNDVFGQSGTLTSKFPSDSERLGYRDLFAGVVGALRNPYAHRLVDPSPEDGGAFMMFMNLLLKLLEDLR